MENFVFSLTSFLRIRNGEDCTSQRIAYHVLWMETTSAMIKLIIMI